MGQEIENQQDQMVSIAYRERLSKRQEYVFSYAGLLFVLAALGCLTGLVWYLFKSKPYDFEPFMTMKRELPSKDVLPFAMFDHYFTIFFTPIVLFLSAVFSAVVGFFLLRTAGAATKEVIPREDFELISQMLRTQNEKGIDHYIRLSSLTGLTGIFTKVGLTGLPLATISLTMFFTLLSIWGDRFFDLAKLTLGAFIGSYVQKQVTISKEESKKQA